MRAINAFGPEDEGDFEVTCDECGGLNARGLNAASASWLGDMHNVTTGHRWTFTVHPPSGGEATA